MLRFPKSEVVAFAIIAFCAGMVWGIYGFVACFVFGLMYHFAPEEEDE